LLSKKISSFFQNMNRGLLLKIDKSKVENEIQDFDKLHKEIDELLLKVKNKKDTLNKKKFYQEWNRVHKNIKIYGFSGSDNIGSDVLILEGIASSNSNGAENGRIKKEDFWVYNGTNKDIILLSGERLFKNVLVKPKRVKFVKSKGTPKDIYLLPQKEDIELLC